jgi:hypothetical protein
MRERPHPSCFSCYQAVEGLDQGARPGPSHDQNSDAVLLIDLLQVPELQRGCLPPVVFQFYTESDTPAEAQNIRDPTLGVRSSHETHEPAPLLEFGKQPLLDGLFVT